MMGVFLNAKNISSIRVPGPARRRVKVEEPEEEEESEESEEEESESESDEPDAPETSTESDEPLIKRKRALSKAKGKGKGKGLPKARPAPRLDKKGAAEGDRRKGEELRFRALGRAPVGAEEDARGTLGTSRLGLHIPIVIALIDGPRISKFLFLLCELQTSRSVVGPGPPRPPTSEAFLRARGGE